MKSITILLLGAILAGAGAFAATYRGHPKRPMIEVPSIIDLGVQDQGRKVKTAIAIRNLGREPLQLTDFQTSCGCLTVGVLKDGSEVGLEKLTVAPGDTAQIIVGLISRGKPGDLLREQVTIRTNDPLRRKVQLELRAEVQGVIIAVSATLALDQLLAGETVMRCVQLRDLGRKRPFSLSTIRSTQPTAIKVLTIERVQQIMSKGSGERYAIGKALYSFGVQITAPLQPGPLHETLEIIDKDNAPITTVLITADIVRRYRLSPSSIVLPRSSSSGPLYEVECVCNNVVNEPFRLIPKRVPPHLKVKIAPSSNQARYHLTIGCPSRTQAPEGLSDLILTASRGKESETLTIPVHIWRPE